MHSTSKVEEAIVDEYLTFDRLISRALIPVIFWLGTILLIGVGIGYITRGLIGEGLVLMFLAPLIWRVMCELAFLMFKIYDQLKALRLTFIRFSEPSPSQEADSYEEIEMKMRQ